MQKEAFLDIMRQAGAILQGHFMLSSGLRSPMYLQCARLLMHPWLAEPCCAALAAKVKQTIPEFDVIVAPAMGGVVVGYEMGRQLEVPTMFCERVDGVFTMRRGFVLEPGAKVLVIEDVVTTGKSSLEAYECIRNFGGVVVGEACLIDRSNGEAEAKLGVPLVSLAMLDVPTYHPDSLPPELAKIPAIKPGSRPGLK